MNQNMKLILELKDKEHKIFKQQLLLAKYRKRWVVVVLYQFLMSHLF